MNEKQRRLGVILDLMEAMQKKCVTEKRDFSTEEQTQWDTHEAEKTKLKTEIGDEQRAEVAHSQRQQSLVDDRQYLDSPANQPLKPAELPPETRGDFQKIEVTRNPELWAHSEGEFYQAVMSAAAGETGGQLVRDLKTHQMESRAATGLTTDIPHDGGYLIPSRVIAKIHQDIFETGELLKRVKKMPSGKGSLTLRAVDSDSRAVGSHFGGVQAYWVDEAGSLTASKAKFRNMVLRSNKLNVVMYITEELKQDGPALGAFMRMAATEELRFAAEAAIFGGTGAGQPIGFTNSGAMITIAAESGQTAGTIKTKNIQNMYIRLFMRNRKNAVWFINQDCLQQLMNLEQVIGTGGVPVYLPPNGISGSMFSTLFGRPVIELEHCSTVGSLNDIMLVDLSGYLLMETGGIKSASSIHVRFLNDEEVFKWTWRLDGQTFRNAPITPLNGTNTLSPFINLAART